MKKTVAYLLAIILFGYLPANAQGKQQRPNVIIVMTDDQGYGDLSCHGNPVLQTPEIDKLYNESVRLTDYHVTPMCTPTRGQLMTGIDAARNGAVNVSSGRTLLRPEIPTMANYFGQNGYTTGLFGKWHLGENYPYTPELRGFQESIWFPSSHISSVPDTWGNDYFDDTYTHNGKKEKFTGYCTDVFMSNAMKFMERSAGENKPFFAYIPLNAPHAPWFAPEENVKEMEAAFATSQFANMEPKLKSNLIHYLAMIRNVDLNVGRLMAFLKAKGLAENTIVIFSTDNGTTFPDYYNAGMRGKKTELWEGGHRVPLFVRWPGGKLGVARDIAGLTQVQDILPTLAELCTLSIPAKAAAKFNGISLAGVLKGKAPVAQDRTLVINYSRMPSSFDYPSPASPSIMRKEGAVVLWKRWRLVENKTLYDLATDPMQKTDVIKKFPAIAAQMRVKLDNWWSEVSGLANQTQNIIIGSNAANPMLLTSCEWMDVLVDQQVQVLSGQHRNSYWNIQVDQAGEYEFELRRWPRESGLALAEAPKDATALPIAAARFAIDGDVQKLKLDAGAKAAVFTVKLDKGNVKLSTWFDDKNGQSICGAYYVYVKRKDGSKPLVANVVTDKYVAEGSAQFTGMLNDRIILNLEKRLLQVDSALFLSGFVHRPGSQKWIAEHIGKFLFAAANTYHYTHDARIKALMDDMTKKYMATQLPDGYMGTYLPKDYWSEWDVWAHKYAIIGLLSYYAETGYQPALASAQKAADLICRTFGNEPGKKDLNLSGHHTGMASGSILEAMLDLYRYTNDEKYLSFSKYIMSNWESATGPKIMSGLEKYGNVTKVGNAKAYEMMSCFLGILKYYKLTGETRYVKAMQDAWKDITTNRLYITGTSSAKEHFQDDQDLPGGDTARMGEGCVTVTWIQFNEQLLGITGELKYAAEIERAVYNHLLAAENMETGCVSYYTPLQGAKPYKCKLTCCLSSVPRAISMIPGLVWGKINNEFSVLLYEAGETKDEIIVADGSHLSLNVKAVTSFPLNGDVNYNIAPSANKKFAINFRIPDWAANYTVSVNGTRQPTVNGNKVRIERNWKMNDKVSVHFDMPLVMLPGGKTYPGFVAFKRGPQILAIDSVLNPSYNEIIKVLPGNSGKITTADAAKTLPAAWVGKQAYRISYNNGSKNTSFVLVPFADAGQLSTAQQVWIPFDNPKETVSN